MRGGYKASPGGDAVIRQIFLRLFGGDAAVIRHHLVVMRLFGKFLRLFGGDVAVIRHHLAVMRLKGRHCRG